MQFALTDEQGFLREAAGQALAGLPSLDAARAALDGDPTLSAWEISRAAGWSGLMSAEAVEGAGLGAMEAMLVAEACGSVLADAHLIGHLPAVTLLEASANADPVLRTALAQGDRRAALVDGRGSLSAQLDGGRVRLQGMVPRSLDAWGADVIVAIATNQGDLVSCCMDDGFDALLAPSFDGSRPLADVQIDAVTRLLDVPVEAIHDALSLSLGLLGAEALGSARACLDAANAYAKERIAFGAPIGSYQAIKHKLVEMLRRIDGGTSLVHYAGWAWSQRRDEFARAAAAVRVAGGDALTFAATENTFILGGIGTTWEHDASLYYRRAEVSRRLAGGLDSAAMEVATSLLAAAEA